MAQIGDLIYGLRVVKDYNGRSYEEETKFSGFEGFVVWNTWDTGAIQVLYTWKQNGKIMSKEIGYIDDRQFKDKWTGKQLAEFIKLEVSKMNVVTRDEHGITSEEVKEWLLGSGIIGTSNVATRQHVSRKTFNALVEEIKRYVNEQINIAVQSLNTLHLPIAVDETIASIIQLRE